MPGVNRSSQPISAGVWSPFVLLHRRQHATRFSHVSRPPRDRGSTWSIVAAERPQYAHRCSSRRSTPRRLTGTACTRGVRTYLVSRITLGRSHEPLDAHTGLPSSWRVTGAFWFIPRRRARLNETTARGSYPALSTRVRMECLSIGAGWLPG